MKLLTAIVQKDDTMHVSDALTAEGFMFTKIASMGGFLQKGNTVLLMGVEDDRVDDALSIIRNNCERRIVETPLLVHGDPDGIMPTAGVPVGGATVFITDVVRFEKM